MPKARLSALLHWIEAQIVKHDAYAAELEARTGVHRWIAGASSISGEHRAAARTLRCALAADKARASTFVPNFDGYPPSEAAPYIAAELRSLATQIGNAQRSPQQEGDPYGEALVEGAIDALRSYARVLEDRANELDPVAEALPDKEIVP